MSYRILRLLALALACALPGVAGAQADWPNKPLRIIVGFPPGQATDLVARLLAEKLTQALGQQVVVDNRPGQAGSIGAAAAAKSAPDGYTMLLSATAPLATNPNLYKDLPYQPLRDFAPITRVGELPFVFVSRPGLAANNVRELVAMAKAKPGSITFASSGNGSTSHLSMEMFKTATGTDFRHVPYKGSPPAFTDVMGGVVDVVFDTAVYALPHVKAGRVKMLGVASAKRSALMPDVPTIAEQGAPGYDSGAWLAMLFPAGTPQPIVARMNTELHKIIRSQDVTEKFFAMGAEPTTSTPEELLAHMRSELAKWGKAVRDSGAKID